ncbi:MAG: UDP-N-acetylmuramate--L-alanine ligase [Alphaproteobacteria bacterium]|nr:UDP-N-acetylmuramate--L-alanine ligase [Alphaproteobacteria bacterium]
MTIFPKDSGFLHFIGIGGIGMSGIAEVLHTQGMRVQGTDLAENYNVQRLRAQGMRVLVGHDGAHIHDESGALPAAVVISSAVKDSNSELQAARTLNIPIVRRADMLAELMRGKWAVAVGGTHGKTTTTAMTGHLFEVAGLDPTVINGGIVNAYGTNVRLGGSDYMVVESDESDGSFIRLPATAVIVTNIDPEHMENYGSFDDVRAAYRRFVTQVPFYGYGVLCVDHPEVQAMIPHVRERRLITYGFSPQAQVRAENLRITAEGSTFDVHFSDPDDVIKDLKLSMPGRHNVQNALAVLAIARERGVAPALMRKAMSSFEGVKRRFTKTGAAGGVTVIDDYGHHPVEIEAVLKTARMAVSEQSGHVIAVVQPHRYSRLHELFASFCTCFHEADHVIVADVYAAGEAPIEGANRDSLVAGIRNHGHRSVTALDGPEALPALVAGLAQPGDLVVCLGAGDITKWAQGLPAALDTLYAAKTKARA